MHFPLVNGSSTRLRYDPQFFTSLDPMTVDKRENRVREMFSSISPRYDFLNHVLSLNVDHFWRWLTTALVPVQGSEPLLDVCTGTGDLALAYWRQSKGQIPIVAADFCHEMMVIGRKKVRQAGAVGAVRFVEADAQQLPFPNDYFQIVCVAFGLRNITCTIKGLIEMARVTRPGGKVAVLEFSMPRNRLFRAAYLTYFRHVLPLVGQTLARNRTGAYNYLPASVLEFPDGWAMAELMCHAGLHSPEWRPLTFGIASLYIGTK
jgi:demethylmenaquinone methyltransferase / 2-methoxy-6-polyprenyl-1,4-benzoquinol methylase